MRQALVVEAEESAEIPYYQRSSASIRVHLRFYFSLSNTWLRAGCPGHCGAGVLPAAITE
jgi:hypothetical protein